MSLLLFSCIGNICNLQCIKGNGERKIHGQLVWHWIVVAGRSGGTLTQNSVQINLTDQLYLTTNFAINCIYFVSAKLNIT